MANSTSLSGNPIFRDPELFYEWVSVFKACYPEAKMTTYRLDALSKVYDSKFNAKEAHNFIMTADISFREKSHTGSKEQVIIAAKVAFDKARALKKKTKPLEVKLGSKRKRSSK